MTAPDRALDWDDEIGGGSPPVTPVTGCGAGFIDKDTEALAVLAKVRKDRGLPPMPPTVEEAPEFNEQEIRDMQFSMDGCTRENAIQLLRERTTLCETSTLEGIRDRVLPLPDQVLVDFADRADKCFVIGTSKSRKSFTALQTALHIVSGGNAKMSFEVGAANLKVCYFNLEIRQHHFEKRAQRMARTLEIDDAFSRNLHVAHRRGKSTTAQHIIQTALAVKAAVIIVDPAYKLEGWDEKDVTLWLHNFDLIVEKTNALLIVVHHEKKGVAGDRQGVDRGSGDGKMSRDYDCALLLAPQRDEPEDCIVFSQVQRNYAPADPVVMRFNHGAFEETDLPPIEATSQSMRAKGGKREPSTDAVCRMIRENGPYSTTELKEILITNGCTTRSAPAYIDRLTRLEADIFEVKERKPGGRKMICTLIQKQAIEGVKS